MNFIKKWFTKKVKEALVNDEIDISINMTDPHVKARRGMAITKSSDELHSRGVTFTMYAATGGTVIEIRNYEEKYDRHVNSLHVIPTDKDIGEELGKIITYEALKR